MVHGLTLGQATKRPNRLGNRPFRHQKTDIVGRKWPAQRSQPWKTVERLETVDLDPHRHGPPGRSAPSPPTPLPQGGERSYFPASIALTTRPGDIGSVFIHTPTAW